ncbi:kinase-like domain-containing protein [Desarmillaria tabescens]|uniref:Kinase-like domain-containing protein n=1 Tax=Armillaria tabescens TaxID=1929756 RepID=A0AA39KF84_ARMTA|nr:kinase-like domain-containing protein [Desarmillaria tabescens]KAK0460094.1 kinase-like domain-containing protein [Desarmillaria tabescens]
MLTRRRGPEPESETKERMSKRRRSVGSSSESDRKKNSMPPPPMQKKKRTRMHILTTPHQSAVLHALLAQIWFQNQRQRQRRPREPSEIQLTRPTQYGPFPSASHPLPPHDGYPPAPAPPLHFEPYSLLIGPGMRSDFPPQQPPPPPLPSLRLRIDHLLNAPSDRPRPTHKRAKPADDQGDEAILDLLLHRQRSGPVHDVNISINNVVKQVTEVLSTPNISDQLLGLPVEEVQCTLDFFQDLLDVSSPPMISKRLLLKTSLKLTRIHDCVPQCLMLMGFKKMGESYPFARGHFGELWRGEVDGIQVAVKQARIFTSDSNIKKILQQVRREAIIWRQCDHPNVLPFYGIYRDSAPSTYCLVSPFMVNGSLRQYMNQTDDPDRHNLALDITRGMDYLHTLSIVHGDLKGDNILITDDHRAVIADFGISFVMGATTLATSSSSSSSRLKGGTAKWQAPEVLHGGRNSFPGDVYSLACVYFEVFDGKIPWSDLKTNAAVIMKVCIDKDHTL